MYWKAWAVRVYALKKTKPIVLVRHLSDEMRRLKIIESSDFSAGLVHPQIIKRKICSIFSTFKKLKLSDNGNGWSVRQNLQGSEKILVRDFWFVQFSSKKYLLSTSYVSLQYSSKKLEDFSVLVR